jgi:PAS domain S-box-containing protein
MTEKISKADDSINLRQRAEKSLQQQLPVQTEMSAAEVEALVHELRVHQIELEMQNDELRLAQLQLGESRDRYADLYDLAPIGYFTISEKGLIAEANLTGATLLGVARKHLLHQPFSRFIALDSQDQYYLYRQQVLESETQRTCELTMRTKAGGSFAAHVEGTAVVDEQGGRNGRFRVAVADISQRVQAETELQKSNQLLETTLTELQSAQAQLVHQERLAAVGQLAAGIAHEFNNILTGILAFADLMKRSADTPASEKTRLQHIIDGSQRAAHLIRQILDFSRKSMRQPRQLDLAAFLKNSIEFFRHTIPENIHISIEIEPGEYLVQADAMQLQQMLTNLVINAQQAMPHGGRLISRLSRRSSSPIDPLPCEYTQTVTADWVVLSLSDTGGGIAAEVLPHIFEPFFTTKGVGEGSGLGLAQVYGIVRQHEGCLDVSSQEGQGTIFTIYLPATAVKALPAHIMPPATDIQLGSGETILLVEDDPLVSQAIQEVLRHLNYEVLTAVNGEEALAIFGEHKDEIALVLTDIVMPKIAGTTLLKKLNAQAPPIAIIMMSGYPQGEDIPDILADGVIDWFYKPIDIQQLAQIVDKALHQ